MSKSVRVVAPKGTATLAIVEGVVFQVESDCWSDTRVSARGGDGYIGPTGGRIAPVYISSDSVQRQRLRFWLREENGADHHIELEDADFRVANGHRIRIAGGGNLPKYNGNYLFAYNFNSRKLTEFISNWVDWCAKQDLADLEPPREPGCGCSLWVLLFVAIPVFWIAGWQNGDFSLISVESALFLPPFLFLLVVARIYLRRDAKAEKRFKAQKSQAASFHQRMLDEFRKEM